MDNWWTTVLWSGSTKLCTSKKFRWFTLKYFFGLHQWFSNFLSSRTTWCFF